MMLLYLSVAGFFIGVTTFICVCVLNSFEEKENMLPTLTQRICSVRRTTSKGTW